MKLPSLLNLTLSPKKSKLLCVAGILVAINSAPARANQGLVESLQIHAAGNVALKNNDHFEYIHTSSEFQKALDNKKYLSPGATLALLTQGVLHVGATIDIYPEAEKYTARVFGMNIPIDFDSANFLLSLGVYAKLGYFRDELRGDAVDYGVGVDAALRLCADDYQKSSDYILCFLARLNPEAGFVMGTKGGVHLEVSKNYGEYRENNESRFAGKMSASLGAEYYGNVILHPGENEGSLLNDNLRHFVNPLSLGIAISF